MPPKTKRHTCGSCHLVYSEEAEAEATVYTGVCPRCGTTMFPPPEEAAPEEEAPSEEEAAPEE